MIALIVRVWLGRAALRIAVMLLGKGPTEAMVSEASALDTAVAAYNNGYRVGFDAATGQIIDRARQDLTHRWN